MQKRDELLRGINKWGKWKTMAHIFVRSVSQCPLYRGYAPGKDHRNPLASYSCNDRFESFFKKFEFGDQDGTKGEGVK